MREPQKHYPKWNKTDKKGQMKYDSTYMNSQSHWDSKQKTGYQGLGRGG